MPKQKRDPKQVEPRSPKRPVEMEPLRFGIDIDGTLTQAPRHFKRLIDALLNLGNEVYIVTARTEDQREQTLSHLRCVGIGFTELVMRPKDWQGTIAQYKVSWVQEKRLHLMIDDNEENCWAVQQQTEALAAHMLPIPEMPEALEAKALFDRGNADQQR